MSDYMHLNRKIRFPSWVAENKVTSDESEIVKKRVNPLETGPEGALYQELTLDRELEIVRVENKRGDNISVMRSEAERMAALTASMMATAMQEFRQQNNHLAALAQIAANNASKPPAVNCMTVKEFAAALGCGAPNVHRRLKVGTIPKTLLIAGTAGKGSHRKFNRVEAEQWLRDEALRKMRKSIGSGTSSTPPKKTRKKPRSGK